MNTITHITNTDPEVGSLGRSTIKIPTPAQTFGALVLKKRVLDPITTAWGSELTIIEATTCGEEPAESMMLPQRSVIVTAGSAEQNEQLYTLIEQMRSNSEIELKDVILSVDATQIFISFQKEKSKKR